MARSIWTGAISFGLVNVPVKLYSAVEQKEVRFHLLHEPDGGRIRRKRVCSEDGEEVPWDEVAKGYELSRGRYVLITKDELEALDPSSTRAIEIEDFVDLHEIDPVYYERTYYVAPASDSAARAYALLLEAMRSRGKVGIARMVMRTKQYLCAVRPMGDVLALSTMQYADEIRSLDEVEGVPAESEPGERELAMAEQLVDSLTAPFEPEKYKDTHRERVIELIERKAAGEEITVPAPEPEDTGAVDLVAALEASLGKLGERSGAGERSGRRQDRAARAATKAPTRRKHTDTKTKTDATGDDEKSTTGKRTSRRKRKSA